MKIQRKVLIIILSLLVVISITSVLISRNISTNIIKQQITNNLINTVQSRVEYIKTYLNFQKEPVKQLSESKVTPKCVIEALREVGEPNSTLMDEKQKHPDHLF